MKRELFFTALKNIATLGRIGYAPASGTCATLVTLPFVFLLKLLITSRTEFFILMVMTLVGGWIIDAVVQLLPAPKGASDSSWQHDPSQIVLDEVIGCLWAFYGITLSWKKLAIGFCLFRFFDIVKPFGIDYMQKLPGGWGIVADDVLAGWYTSLILFFV